VNIQKINWKLFFEDIGTLKPEDFFGVFNTWIPQSPEVFVDVADYQHVHDGPLVFLSGHYVSYSIDSSGDKLGLLYSRNREHDGSNEEKILESLTEALNAANRLKTDASLSGQLKFNTQELLFLINDRALSPNTLETFQEVKPILENVLAKKFGTRDLSLEHLDNPRDRFSVKIRFEKPLDI
jgi:hypothetical protein